MALFEPSVVEIAGATLETLVGGVGQPPMCISHPLTWHSPSSVHDDRALQAFATASQVVWVNARGSGNSSPIRQPGDLTFHQQVEDIEALRRQLRVERWVFAGGSAGGVLGLRYALAYPEALAGLILWVSTASTARLLEDPDSRLSPRHPSWATDLAAARVQIEHQAPGQATRRWETVRDDLRIYCEGSRPLIMAEAPDLPDRMRVTMEELTTFDVVDRLGEIRVPTLVVAGGRDEIIPLLQARTLAGIPQAEFVVFEETTHTVGAEDSARFGAVVQRFMDERVRR